jgi:hypothetical protein
MVKVLIYSSKEIYDNASYEGRAESDFVAYRRDDGYYEITKNRTGRYLGSYCLPHTLAQEFRWMERDEFDKELKDYELSGRYKMHQYIELMKNFKDAEVAQG